MQKRPLAYLIGTLATLSGPGAALATNGMNLEGYGPVATAMGGAASAYYNGNSAVMNNPATLALMEEGTQQLGIGLRMLGPDITNEVPAMGIKTDSDGTSYYMPSISYIRKDQRFSWGAAMLAQGGMGTEYGENSELFSGGMSMMGSMTPLSGDEVRSEVSVGRLMFPIAYQVNDRLNVGATLDVAFGSLDLMMDMDGAHMAAMMMGQGGSVTGTMAQGLGQMMQGGMISDVNWARFAFSNDSDYYGEAKGLGLGAKLGFTYQVNDRLRVGGSYHLETNLSNFETDKGTMSMGAVMGGQSTRVDVDGEINVNDFQWPASATIGAAYRVNDRLMVAADVKRLFWSEMMDTFGMTFTADMQQSNQMAQAFAGSEINVVMDQGWEDQTIFHLGAQYQVTDQLAVRLGANITDNPVPSRYLNPLFPATIERHLTGGFSYSFDDSNDVAFSLVYAPEVKETNGDGIEISHSQLNWGLVYSHTFR